jgi:hypothetical protein
MLSSLANHQDDTMIAYHAYFLDRGGHIFSGADFMADHDEAAKVYAAQTFRTGIGKGYEIWDDDHLVHVERYRPRNFGGCAPEEF